MIISIKLLILGIMVAFGISELEVFEKGSLPMEPSEYFRHATSFTGSYVKFLYYALIIIVIPFMVIPPLKEKLGKKTLYLYTFLSGITFGLSIIGINTLSNSMFL